LKKIQKNDGTPLIIIIIINFFTGIPNLRYGFQSSKDSKDHPFWNSFLRNLNPFLKKY
jgi:hypothetical protein